MFACMWANWVIFGLMIPMILLHILWLTDQALPWAAIHLPICKHWCNTNLRTLSFMHVNCEHTIPNIQPSMSFCWTHLALHTMDSWFGMKSLSHAFVNLMKWTSTCSISCEQKVSLDQQVKHLHSLIWCLDWRRAWLSYFNQKWYEEVMENLAPFNYLKVIVALSYQTQAICEAWWHVIDVLWSLHDRSKCFLLNRRDVDGITKMIALGSCLFVSQGKAAIQ